MSSVVLDLNSMHVTRAQKVFTYMGYYANAFAREFVRDVERLTHPMPQGESRWVEVKERIKRVVFAIFSGPLALVLGMPAMVCYSIAACIGHGRFELIEPKTPPNFWEQKSIKVISLNACFQDPWSPLTGGVVPPFDPVPGFPSRIAGLADAVAKEAPVLYMGQEFENLGAQDEFIRLMRENGYSYFLRDLGANDPICNNSGLFVASKVPLEEIRFAPYPSEDRAGLAKWSKQGALAFAVSLQREKMGFVNVHLNYGGSREDQAARNRQLKRHALPLLGKHSVLLGDLNFNTQLVPAADSGLEDFKNELAGVVTCTDDGKHVLRGKSKIQQGKPCADCEEWIDGLIYDPRKIRVSDCESKRLPAGNRLLSDHHATIANLSIGKN